MKMNDDMNELYITISNSDVSVPEIPDIPEIKHIIKADKNEVFNIPGNYYSYEDAQTLCKAYGAQLASYSQIEDAYNDGGEWCNYGWSKGQMALFPTQKSTYKKLKSIKGHENDCGRPGINGGYMANPDNKYGANCYGKKPPITDTEKKLMEINQSYPPETGLDDEVNKWKKLIDDILISPFNSTSWYKV
jgi:hypothetical protein